MAAIIAATPSPAADQLLSGDPEDNSRQRYCLKWNNYQSSVTTTFKELLAVEDFVDITLSAEGGALRAHKVVLSACSPYFRDILKGISAWQHPVIVLKDVPYEDLQGIVEFIYHGEVSVDKECLASFLKTAQMLHVKGLTEDQQKDNQPKSRLSHSRKNSQPKRSLPFQQQPSTIAPSKKNEDHQEMEDEELEINDEEELEEEEEEEEEIMPMQQQQINPFLGLSPASITNAALALANVAAAKSNQQQLSSNTGNELEHSQPEQQEMKRQHFNLLSSATDLLDPDVFASSGFGYPPPLKQMLSTLNNGSNPDAAPSSSSSPSSSNLAQKKTCPYCYQQLSWHALSRHIRDMHKCKSNYVTCKFCQKMFRNKNSLGCHMWRFHKEAKDTKDVVNAKGDGATFDPSIMMANQEEESGKSQD